MIPPNVAGNWSVEEKILDDKNTIFTPTKITYTTKFEQNGRFVSSKFGNTNFLGVWKFNCKSGWELYIISDDDDNDTFILSPLCVKKNIVNKMDSISFEAGQSRTNPKQIAQVSYSTWKRI